MRWVSLFPEKVITLGRKCDDIHPPSHHFFFTVAVRLKTVRQTISLGRETSSFSDDAAQSRGTIKSEHLPLDAKDRLIIAFWDVYIYNIYIYIYLFFLWTTLEINKKLLTFFAVVYNNNESMLQLCNVDSTDTVHMIQISNEYTPVNKHSNGTCTIWRCISYWKWGYSIAMLVYQSISHWFSLSESMTTVGR